MLGVDLWDRSPANKTLASSDTLLSIAPSIECSAPAREKNPQMSGNRKLFTNTQWSLCDSVTEQTLTQIVQDACLLVADVIVRHCLSREDLRPSGEGNKQKQKYFV